MLGALITTLDELADADPSALADSATIVELHHQLARLEAIAARATARWDAESRWAVDGARSGSAWLAARLHTPREQAQRCLRLGRAMRALPHAEAAWTAGEVTGAHVSALASARSEHVAEAMDRDEASLVDEARTLTFRGFQRRLDYWRQCNDLDAEERRAARQVEDRRVHLSQTFQGAWVLDGVLDPISGTIVSDTLAAIERELFESDWADTKERLGFEPRACDLARTPAQRRVDALVEMATRARTAPAGGRRPEPLFSVLIGLPRFEQMCELVNGAVVTPGSLVPWIDNAWIERAVFGPPSRVIDVGVQRRFFTGGIRRGVELRDEGRCFHNTCEEPIAEIDHIEPAGWGGLTVQENGRGACRFHNRQRHRGPP